MFAVVTTLSLTLKLISYLQGFLNYIFFLYNDYTEPRLANIYVDSRYCWYEGFY